MSIDFSSDSNFDNGFKSDISSSDVSLSTSGGSASSSSVSSVERSNGGDSLFVSLNNSFDPADGETVTLTIQSSGWQNPSDSSNTYDGVIQFNPQSGGAQDTGTLTLTRGETEAANEANADASWDSGTTRWQGQELVFDASSTTGQDLSNFQIREWDDTASTFSAAVGDLETEFSVDSSTRTRVISTDNFEGNYVITAANSANSSQREAVITDNTGAVIDTAHNTSASPEVEFALQDMSAEFADDTVELGDSIDLEVDSNRNNYNLNISSDNLTQDQLEDVFSSESPTPVGDDTIEITGIDSEVALNATFLEEYDIEEGDEFTLDLEATDTTATANATVSVGQAADATVEFEETQINEHRGDIVTISATSEELDRYNLTFGGEDVNYNASFEVQPNDDDEVVLNINTYWLGRTTNESKLYSVDEGSVANFSQSRADLNYVLGDALYDVIAEQHSGDADTPEEYNVAVVNLQQREDTSVTVHTAPYASFNQLTEVEDINEAANEGSLTEDDTIAVKDPDRDSSLNFNGDTVVHEIEVSGFEGSYDTISDLAAHQNAGNVSLFIEQEDAGINADPINLTLPGAATGDATSMATSNTRVVSDLENDTLYVIVDSDEFVDEQNAEINDEFTANFTVTEAYEKKFVRSGAEAESANGSYTLVDREASFDTRGGEVRVSPTEEAEITGETTVAPGTELTVRARATGESPFLETADATVDAEGNFVATFDFSGVNSGQNFTASIRRQSFEDDAETPGVVGEVSGASFQVSDLSLSSTSVEAGEDVDVSANVTNNGDVAGNQTVSILVDDTEVDSQEVSLDVNESTTVESTISTSDLSGDVTVEVASADDSASTTLTVETEATPTATPSEGTATPEPGTATETTSQDQPGFGAGLALIALLGAALLAARRNAF
ncbi:PGF-CTERM sorting domain-containing protein [Natronomonas halophila]|uniref:BGTF surface domain-containing protein n=1 Tax=Natronomonas halophila TaxID=2747817 RepID=UPI0015B58B38|nr:BGTF surface domain-containing protein [Natronomonas halophila]QLD84142.1 PGF-CTERM sorting domain-containing protein [Natronomonas halophila]